MASELPCNVPFSPPTRRWFAANFEHPTPIQTRGWPLVARGEHSLLLAPTGSGKTLAAFLWCIDRLLDDPGPPGVKVVYVSPLKALVYDVERNLRAPLAGISVEGELENPPRVAVRTGDTSAAERRRQLKYPPDILVTTPESLYLLLGSAARENLRAVRTVIADEIHALAPTKRGSHLALSLERLAALADRDPQRIGLSATVRPVGEVARFLGGDRPVSVADALGPPTLELEVVVPVPDMENPRPEGSTLEQVVSNEQGAESAASIWPSIYPRLLEQIRAHRSTILFVNSRGLCERLALRINELAEEELVQAHHGSVSHTNRRQMEEMLKTGKLKGIVATSSLELGIDMGAVDLVLQVESPGTVARGLQRIGRSGHKVGEISVGKLFPKFRGDLLECAVVSRKMAEGAIESARFPRNPLDVLAQQVVAMCSVEPVTVARLEALVRRSAPFQELGHDLLLELLDMLSGRYPSTEFADLRPRITWDRDTDLLQARPGAKALALVNAGTIPDRGLYGVYLGPDGPRVGELDEEMVYEIRPGQNFLLGASTWRVQEITRDRVVVSPAPGEPGRMPFWRGDSPGRPVELGRALGEFVRRLGSMPRQQAQDWLAREYPLDRLARSNLIDYLEEQQRSTGTLPTDRTITVERFRDEVGDWRVCILSPWGARVHAPWALAIEASVGDRAGFQVQTMWTDDGIALRLADAEEPPDLGVLFPPSENLQDLVVEQLGHSALFASTFRENAARALLLPRRRPGKRTPLWAQRLKSQNLLAVARQYSGFPILLETYRSCLQDVFDLPSLIRLMAAVERREIRVEQVETPSPSPFSRSLVFAYVAEYLYAGDTPLAERKAQALTLDRNLLRELLGQEQLRELLDPAVLEGLELELQHLAEDRRARDPEGVIELLRRLGDLSAEELARRCLGDPEQWLPELEARRRVVRIPVAGCQRLILAQDAALYRDALGSVPPAGLPAALLEPVANSLEQLVLRYAHTHGPFVSGDLERRYAVPRARLEPTLNALVARNKLLLGDFRPGGTDREWCNPEVLRRLRRRSLVRLRNQVSPVEAAVMARFALDWHDIGADPAARLETVVERLEGLPLPFSDLDRHILPARIPGYDPRRMDELGQLGAVVWVGCGSLGARDGKIALYRRDRVRLLCPGPAPFEDPGPLHRGILEWLETRGASFFYDLLRGCGNPMPGALLQALWDLVWSGHITNDSISPLRYLGKPGHRRVGSTLMAGAGRWVLVHHLLGDRPSDTERLSAQAGVLLERYGVVTREAVAGEGFPGGWTPLYETFKALEQRGTLRRGYFVEGLGGAQFARGATVDRLRDARRQGGQPRLVVLAATDPANLYGTLLPWPESRGRPRRAAGCLVVLGEGEPVLFVDGRGKRLTSFPAAREAHLAVPAAMSLAPLAQRSRGKILRVQEIDGEPAAHSSLAPAFREAGFRNDFTGLMLMGRTDA